MVKCPFNVPHCNNGIIRYPDNTHDYCICRDFKRVKKEFKDSEIPNKYFKFHWDLKEDPYIFSMEKKKGIKYKELISKFDNAGRPIDYWINKNLRIWAEGKTGTGKTQFSVCLALIAMIYGYKPFFLSYRELLDHAWSKDKDRKEYLIDKARNADILIIDDFGAGYHNGNSENKNNYTMLELDKIIRSQNNGMVILTTNLNKDIDLPEIKEKYPQMASYLFTAASVYYSFVDMNLREVEKPDFIDDLI